MTTPKLSEPDQLRRIVDLSIRIGAIVLIAYVCFSILSPFLLPTLWGVLLAVALAPLHARIASMLGGRRKLAAVILTLLMLLGMLLPAALIAVSIVDNAGFVLQSIESGSFKVPPPPENVASWPIIGGPLFDAWNLAANNLEAAVTHYGKQLIDVGLRALATLGTMLGQVLLFAVATIIAGVLLATAQGGAELAKAVARRLAGDRGDELAELASATIQGVTKGVLGVALIQALMFWIGMVVAGVPWSGVIALVALVLAIFQLPPLLIVWVPVVWAFAHLETLPAVLFAIWIAIAGISDNVLKPILLARGLTTPMLIVLLGAIGGMMLAGILGLFVGAVVLALGYELFIRWLRPAAEAAA